MKEFTRSERVATAARKKDQPQPGLGADRV